MNVLVAVPWDRESGGVVSVVDALCAHLRDAGHEVVLALPWSEAGFRRGTSKLGFPCYHLQLRPPWESERPLRSAAAFLLKLPGSVRRVAGVLRRHDIDVVNVHFPERSSLHYALAARLADVPMVVSVHGTDAFPGREEKGGRPATVDFVLREAASIVCPSEAFAGRVRRSLPADAPRVVVIPNGIDPEALDDAEETRAPAGPPGEDGPLELVSVGRLDRRKGHGTAIRALRKLVDGGLDVRLEIVGEGPDRAVLEALAEREGVDRRITFAGGRERENVIAALREKDVFVHASEAESFGLGVVEAMATGLPVVATRVGGIPEVVADGETGLLVEPGDPEALARAVRKLAREPARRRRMGARGRERVDERFLARRMGSRYEAEYRRLAGVASPGPRPGRTARPAPDAGAGPR